MKSILAWVRIVQLTTMAQLCTCLSVAQAGGSKSSENAFPKMVAQTQSEVPDAQTSPPTMDLPPGGTSIEDLLLQKGTITMDEWIQIRAQQEYKVADQIHRLDRLESWKSKTELLPILRDKVNFGLNALQFLYGHVDGRVPEGRSHDSFSIRRSEVIFWGRLSDFIPRWHP